ncbi:MAG: hypothetical protein D6680_20055 [Cyanobacteria bacterium J007]|nr:MAG: hypothetical protein D6680_20055 [Cyanobacteria bacterium J007]
MHQLKCISGKRLREILDLRERSSFGRRAAIARGSLDGGGLLRAIAQSFAVGLDGVFIHFLIAINRPDPQRN